jgi:hypothetical protein
MTVDVIFFNFAAVGEVPRWMPVSVVQPELPSLHYVPGCVFLSGKECRFFPLDHLVVAFSVHADTESWYRAGLTDPLCDSDT